MWRKMLVYFCHSTYQMKFTPLFITSLLIVLIATLIPGNGKIAGNYLDKAVHFLLFAILAYQALKAAIDKKYFPDILLGCILLGLLTEILQQFIPGRNMDIYDGVADTLGVISAYYFYKNVNDQTRK